MAEFNGKQGVWRTIGGRKVFIVNGQDLPTAMKLSGKFTKEKTPKIEEEEKNMGDISNCALYMIDENKMPIAYITYLKLNDMKKSDLYKSMFGGKRIAIEMIQVNEEFRRKGYATKLFKKLQSKYPNEEMRFGQLEPDGEKLLKSIANITDSELLEGHQRRTYYGKIK